MDVLTMPVTLVVKAPNQRVGDHTVDCALDWTIKDLKEHLSSVYPSKPEEHQQRLIYSGKLLQDHHTLQEILRHVYAEDQTIHTVHLVCSVSVPDAPLKDDPVVTNKSNGKSDGAQASEGLRQRHFTEVSNSSPVDQSSQPSYVQDYSHYGMNHTYPTSTPAMFPGMPYSPEQMMWYQQMYAQQMAQYMQYYSGMQGNNPIPTVTTSQNPPVNQNGVNLPNPQPQANNNNQQMIMNAAGGQAMFEDDEEDINRDWLDWSYILCRFSMLVAIVYFYSTLGRFFMVVGFFFLIYIYQAGWFRLNRRVQRAPQQQGVPQADEQPEREGEEERQETEDTENNVEEENTTPPHPGNIRVALSFFVTFFTSLMPQQPGAVNAN